MLIGICSPLTNARLLSELLSGGNSARLWCRRTIVSNTCNVIISKSYDIYSNLALENWLYTNLNFEDQADRPKLLCTDKNHGKVPIRNKSKPLMLVWRNNPALVIGRHQNPWLEGRMNPLKLYNINLARRQSGGGCVYHDMNNINISLIGHRDRFSQRQNNLKFVAQLILDMYGIKCEPTKRHDLVISETGCKITGSAAKLGRFNCYHHFTLLVDTDTALLHKVIRQTLPTYLETKSSSSVRSKVQNLRDIKKNLTPNIIINDLAHQFSKSIGDPTTPNVANHSIELVQPDELQFPGYNQMRQDFMNWKWIFGMTPKFILRKTYHYIDNNEDQKVQLEVDINHGLIERIITILNDKESVGCFDELVGDQFNHENIKLKLSKFFQVDEHNLNPGAEDNRKLLFATFLLQLVNDLLE